MHVVYAVTSVVVENALLAHIHLVHHDRLDVGLGGVLIHTEQDVNVAGHVDEMAGGGEVLAQHRTGGQG